MLRLSEDQWRKLQSGDARRFVDAVCDQFMATRPDMQEAPGTDTVRERMQAAHDYAMRAGYASNAHVVALMFVAADAPGIPEDPLVDAYLRKPGATPEQRLDDLLAVMNHQLVKAD